MSVHLVTETVKPSKRVKGTTVFRCGVAESEYLLSDDLETPELSSEAIWSRSLYKAIQMD